jgi:type II secretory pathway predicted ATPase ExeA
LSSNPFSKSSVAGYLPLLSGARQAVAQLTQAIENRDGLLVLTGEVGTGKTTVLNQLRLWLAERRMPTAYLFNPLLDSPNFIDFVLAEFRIQTAGSAGSAFTQFTNWLFGRHREGATAVLIVDEAQSLAPSVLQALGPLLNLESSGEKLLQIVLAGQPELNDILRRPEFRPIRQRVALRCRTAPLAVEETRAYVAARLQAGGASGEAIFSAEALEAVHFYSRGIPRVVNLLCEHALAQICAEKMQSVPASVVDKVAREFQFENARPPSFLNDHLTDATLRAMRGRSTTRENLTPLFVSEAALARNAASQSFEAEEPQTITKPEIAVSFDVPANQKPVLLQVVPSPTVTHNSESTAARSVRSQSAGGARSSGRFQFGGAKERWSEFVSGLLCKLQAAVGRESHGDLGTATTLRYLRARGSRRHDWMALAKQLIRERKQVWASVMHWLNQPIQVRPRG